LRRRHLRRKTSILTTEVENNAMGAQRPENFMHAVN
jgi:hypothetical protein